MAPFFPRNGRVYHPFGKFTGINVAFTNPKIPLEEHEVQRLPSDPLSKMDYPHELWELLGFDRSNLGIGADGDGFVFPVDTTKLWPLSAMYNEHSALSAAELRRCGLFLSPQIFLQQNSMNSAKAPVISYNSWKRTVSYVEPTTTQATNEVEPHDDGDSPEDPVAEESEDQEDADRLFTIRSRKLTGSPLISDIPTIAGPRPVDTSISTFGSL